MWPCTYLIHSNIIYLLLITFTALIFRAWIRIVILVRFALEIPNSRWRHGREGPNYCAHQGPRCSRPLSQIRCRWHIWKRGRGSGVRNILIESRETQATYSHIITYHSMRVDAKMIERGVPHIVVPPGNSWALFAVFAWIRVDWWELDNCSRPSHRGETKVWKQTVEVYRRSYRYTESLSVPWIFPIGSSMQCCIANHKVENSRDIVR